MIIEIRDIPQGTGVQRIQIDLMPLAQAATKEVLQYSAQPVVPASPVNSPSSAKPQAPQDERPAKPIPQEMTDLEL